MKIFKLFIVCSLLFIICSTVVKAQDKSEKEVKDFLAVHGLVVDNDQPIPDVNIRLYKGSEKVDSAYTGKNGKFKFMLANDAIYTLEFEKLTYQKAMAIVNTFRKDVDPKNKNNAYNVDFVVDINDEIKPEFCSTVPAEDLDILDFPIVKVYYKKSGENESFVNDSKYTKYVKDNIKKIKEIEKKEEAKKKEEEKKAKAGNKPAPGTKSAGTKTPIKKK